MIIVVLCGGKGTRLEGLDLPKPLCTIQGKSLLYRVLDALPSEVQSVTLFYNAALEAVQFQRTVVHSCSMRTDLNFVRIPIQTRGPVETAYIGVHAKMFPPDEPILFIDNDTINTFSLADIDIQHLSVGTCTTLDKTKPYSFVAVRDGNIVTDIREKVPISTTYCAGLYFFPSIRVFSELSRDLFESNPLKKEYFMSDLYRSAVQAGRCVRTFVCKDSIALGTKEDIAENISRVKKIPMRLCFDIDNTILTNSERRGSDEGITPIASIVEMIRRLHAEGNTIVLHTARSMQTCNSNLGQANKRGMMKVFKKLEEYAIPYDEIYFGKPWADVYIDDKALNQYTNPSLFDTMFNVNLSRQPTCLPRNCSNNENTLHKEGKVLVKRGPPTSLEGEIYFYRHMAPYSLRSAFPTYFSSSPTEIRMEFIDGITVSHLFRNYLLTRPIFYSIYTTLSTLHTADIDDGSCVTRADILENYTGKLESRIRDKPHVYGSLYRLHDVVSTAKTILTTYIESPTFSVTNVVHGDPWFDNMIVTPNQDIKLLDMKGKNGSALSLKGDAMADYAKLYQSILGFDMIINGERYDAEYERVCRRMLADVLPFPIDDPVFEASTAVCILKTFTFFSNPEPIAAVYKSLGKLTLFSFLLDC